jgi:hypothetical protein
VHVVLIVEGAPGIAERPGGGGVPSSLIFAGLVATWLAVFVPMTARRRRQMTRPSDTAMSSRVLERPVRTRTNPRGSSTAGPGTEEVGDSVNGRAGQDTRYRPGRGGYDPEAAELAARARYTFRQRTVLGLVLLAVASALVAAGLSVPEAWWVHGAADVLLIAYLANLRRQVRSENAIRARRAARLAGGRPGRRGGAGSEHGGDHGDDAELDDYFDSTPRLTDDDRWPRYSGPDDGGHGLGPDAEFHRGERPALPRLKPVPFPLRPFGTQQLELDDEDPELHDLGYAEPWGYRRAAGQ